VIDDFEVINEPDGAWAFLGTPQQYAATLADACDAIHAADPQALVVLGGIMDIGATGEAWMNAMLATPGADAVHKFDIANIHIRTPNPTDTGPVVRRWLHYLADTGFRGPLWVTEAGYPADPAFQTQPGYQDGRAHRRDGWPPGSRRCSNTAPRWCSLPSATPCTAHTPLKAYCKAATRSPPARWSPGARASML
jgi:hypothetical protein